MAAIKKSPSAKTKAKGPPERQRIPLSRATEEMRAALKAAGYYVTRESLNFEVYDKKDGTVVGILRQVPHQGYQLFVAQPIIKTPTDLDLSLSELHGVAEGLNLIQEAWVRYTRTHTERDWQSYLGALAAFFTRSTSQP